MRNADIMDNTLAITALCALVRELQARVNELENDAKADSDERMFLIYSIAQMIYGVDFMKILSDRKCWSWEISEERESEWRELINGSILRATGSDWREFINNSILQ